MGEPTEGRSLADILREAGVEAPRTGRLRRRATDPDPRDGADPAAARRPPDVTGPQSGVGKVVYGRRKTDLLHPDAPPLGLDPETGLVAGVGSEPTTAAIPGLRPSRKPGVPGAGGATAASPATTGNLPRTVWTDEQRAAERARLAAERAAAERAEEAADDEPLTAVGAVLAWLRFGVEIVLAAAVGVAVYYLFSVLWELLPYVAVGAAPLAVTGLVGGVGLWRSRQGRGPVELPLLLVLLFAGTLLVIVPAAGLLSGP